MRALNLNIGPDNSPLYRKIADSLREKLQDQVLKPGELLPSTRDLGRQLQVHRHTVTRALEELVAEGWLDAEPGRGYRILSQQTNLNLEPQIWPEFEIVKDLADEPDLQYAFPSGKPDLRLFPKKEFFKVLRSKIRESQPEELLGYSSPAGSWNFRSQIKSYLARIRGLTRGELLITHGSQEAILLLGLLFGRKAGSKIAVEQLGYPPAWDALRLGGAELLGIPVDQDGICVDVLEQRLKQERISLLYLTPLHQYPTTATLSPERRHKLLSLISEYSLPVIEDDYDHEFHYHGQANRPLASDDQSGLVMYVSTFSKLIYPSSRLGFCLVPPAIFEALKKLKRSSSRQNDLLIQETMADWMHSGGLEKHLRKMKRTYHHRLKHMSSVLDTMGLEYPKPSGGMSLWVNLGKESKQTLRKCQQQGLNLRPGADFLLNSERDVHHIRLGFASTTEEEIDSGLAILRACL